MSQSIPSSVTIEEAVARMVNMDYIPTGFTLLEMTDAFREEAEVEYENAKIDNLPEDQIAPLKVRMESCSAKHSLAQQLLESLQHEAKHPEGSMIIVADDFSSQVRLTLESVSDWAADRYGIGIPEWSSEASVTDDDMKDVHWEDIKIKIYAEYKIGVFFGEQGRKQSSFQKIGLMGKRKHEPNKIGGILIGLSKKKKYPPNNSPAASKGNNMSNFIQSLKLLTGLSDDPFWPVNKPDGYKPRFKLVDDMRNAAERAKEKAVHCDTDNYELSKQIHQDWARAKVAEDAKGEASDFERENGEAQDWLDKRE